MQEKEKKTRRSVSFQWYPFFGCNSSSGGAKLCEMLLATFNIVHQEHIVDRYIPIMPHLYPLGKQLQAYRESLEDTDL